MGSLKANEFPIVSRTWLTAQIPTSRVSVKPVLFLQHPTFVSQRLSLPGFSVQQKA